MLSAKEKGLLDQARGIDPICREPPNKGIVLAVEERLQLDFPPQIHELIDRYGG